MSSLKKFAAYASALALATGTTLAGAGIATAQDNGDEATGSLGIGELDLGDIAGDLETAGDALNSPVVVTPNETGGPTVTYANETDGTQLCMGFAAPYQTVIDEDLDTNYDDEDVLSALELVIALEDGGGLSIFGGDEDGEPITYEDPNPDDPNDVAGILIGLVLSGDTEGTLPVDAGDEVSWTAPTPDTPALSVVGCVPEEGDELDTYTGIDPQVVADQMNDLLPGGSLELVSPDMISGGSVEAGAFALGSLAGGGDNGNGDDNDGGNGED